MQQPNRMVQQIKDRGVTIDMHCNGSPHHQADSGPASANLAKTPTREHAKRDVETDTKTRDKEQGTPSKWALRQGNITVFTWQFPPVVMILFYVLDLRRIHALLPKFIVSCPQAGSMALNTLSPTAPQHNDIPLQHASVPVPQSVSTATQPHSKSADAVWV